MGSGSWTSPKSREVPQWGLRWVRVEGSGEPVREIAGPHVIRDVFAVVRQPSHQHQMSDHSNGVSICRPVQLRRAVSLFRSGTREGAGPRDVMVTDIHRPDCLTEITNDRYTLGNRRFPALSGRGGSDLARATL